MTDQLLGLTDYGPDTDELRAMVASQLGAGVDDVEAVRIEEISEVPYDLVAITTASRHWIRGHALLRGERMPFAFFVKVVQSFARSPLFAQVPPAMRDDAARSVPWRTEPAVYRSDLGERLPPGLSMPAARGVFDLDEAAAIWLDEVTPTAGVWDLDTFERAAHLVGRMAASPRVGACEVRGTSRQEVRAYFEGRIVHQVMPVLDTDGVWAAPLLSGAFDGALRERMLLTARNTRDLVDELEAMPRLPAHGDTSPNNLLLNGDGFVLIDFGFWGEQPVGFDLAQLVLGDVQTGRRPAADLAELDAHCLAAYVAGLRAEGEATPESVVARGHALKTWIFSGISSLPVELLDRPPTPELRRVAAARAAITEYALDRLENAAIPGRTSEPQIAPSPSRGGPPGYP